MYAIQFKASDRLNAGITARNEWVIESAKSITVHRRLGDEQSLLRRIARYHHLSLRLWICVQEI